MAESFLFAATTTPIARNVATTPHAPSAPTAAVSIAAPADPNGPEHQVRLP